MLAILAVVLVTGTVFAAIIISNTVHIGTSVTNPSQGVTLSQVNVDAGFPDLTASSVPGVIYDTGIRLQSNGIYNQALVIFEISKSDGTHPLVASDVTVMYFDGTQWQSLPMTLSGGTLVGTFGPTGGFPVTPGYDQTTWLSVEFNALGNFGTDVFATDG